MGRIHIALLGSVVEDDPNRVSLPRPKAAYPVTQIDAINTPCSLNRSMMHRERHRVTLAKWNHLWPRLHARPLFGEHEFAAREIPLRFREQDCYLYREDVLAVEILMQTVIVPFAILKEQWRWPLLACVMASFDKV